MQSRMDKYNANITGTTSRTQKNQSLYENVRASEITEFDVNSNVSIIDDNAEVINVNRVKSYLTEHYKDDDSYRRGIGNPIFEEPEIEEINTDTKEYDINAILAKAKEGKNIDYSKDRLRKIRDAQFDILANLDLELKKVEESSFNHRKKEEEDLINLINTITELELKNKTEQIQKVNQPSSDHFFTELIDTDTVTQQVSQKDESSSFEIVKDYKPEDLIKEPEENEKYELTQEEIDEKTLEKIDINSDAYEDFGDVSKRDKGTLVLKTFIFIVILALIFGAVYILDNILSLGLFK